MYNITADYHTHTALVMVKDLEDNVCCCKKGLKNCHN